MCKYFKYISTCCNTYDFVYSRVERQQHNIHKYPILGRDGELQLYLRMLRSAQEMFRKENKMGYQVNRHTSLLIRGDARQGLTRMLDEMVYCTPPDVPINRFSLNSQDRNVSTYF